MLLIAAELQDVPLRQPQMLQQHPRRMRELRRLLATQLHRQAFDNIFKLGMRSSTRKELVQMFAQHLLVIFGHPFLPTQFQFT